LRGKIGAAWQNTFQLVVVWHCQAIQNWVDTVCWASLLLGQAHTVISLLRFPACNWAGFQSLLDVPGRQNATRTSGTATSAKYGRWLLSNCNPKTSNTGIILKKSAWDPYGRPARLTAAA
jgi:hypothetical protein